MSRPKEATGLEQLPNTSEKVFYPFFVFLSSRLNANMSMTSWPRRPTVVIKVVAGLGLSISFLKSRYPLGRCDTGRNQMSIFSTTFFAMEMFNVLQESGDVAIGKNK